MILKIGAINLCQFVFQKRFMFTFKRFDVFLANFRAFKFRAFFADLKEATFVYRDCVKTPKLFLQRHRLCVLDPYGWFVVVKTVDVQCKSWICSAKCVHVHPDGRSARAAKRGPCRRKNNSGVLTRSPGMLRRFIVHCL